MNGVQKNVKNKRKRSPVVVEDDPTRTEITDSRRTFSQLMLNAFNSCDLQKLENTFHAFCTPDLYSICIYEGISNPYASNVIETRTIANHMTLWSALFKSAPDFLFKGQFVEAYVSKVSEDKRCVVRSTFTMNGTRIVDVKIASKINEQVIKRKLENKDEFPTSEQELMAQIHQQLVESYQRHSADGSSLDETDSPDDDAGLDDCSLLQECDMEPIDLSEAVEAAATTHAAQDTTPEDGEEVETVTREIVESLFVGDKISVGVDGSTLYAESTPLPESLAIHCAGTFTVYVNADNKIEKMEFLYTAMDTVPA